MFNESYEEYIRSILGYPNYQSNNYINTYNNEYAQNRQRNSSNSEIEGCYPEIYKIIYPMINKACRNNFEPITPELVERITDDIYSSVEADNQINININLTNEIGTNENRSDNTSRRDIKKENNKINNIQEDKKIENRGEDRQFRNRNLRDLIKILIIRELLGGSNIINPRSTSYFTFTTQTSNETSISRRTN